MPTGSDVVDVLSQRLARQRFEEVSHRLQAKEGTEDDLMLLNYLRGLTGQPQYGSLDDIYASWPMKGERYNPDREKVRYSPSALREVLRGAGGAATDAVAGRAAAGSARGLLPGSGPTNGAFEDAVTRLGGGVSEGSAVGSAAADATASLPRGVGRKLRGIGARTGRRA